MNTWDVNKISLLVCLSLSVSLSLSTTPSLSLSPLSLSLSLSLANGYITWKRRFSESFVSTSSLALYDFEAPHLSNQGACVQRPGNGMEGFPNKSNNSSTQPFTSESLSTPSNSSFASPIPHFSLSLSVSLSLSLPFPLTQPSLFGQISFSILIPDTFYFLGGGLLSL
ncbi:unnamed protein product [Acanthosepion pharaonis]|uniref:Uncharacterized protein n=1 Tax=Acanthosepion pharaonis TaxID=158019 RepID=A0A812B0B9_ACAPH|nr:unnamed protein product [Sepia pharaonis]